MDANLFDAPRKYGSRLLSILSILTASFVMTGCATNSSITSQSDVTGNIVTKPSDRVAITYNNSNSNLNNLPPEVSAFLNEGRVDSTKISTVTPTRVGKGSYNHAMLNNAKATDIVAIDPNKFAPPSALPDYGTEENMQHPVDFVAQAPAYFAAAQPPQVVTRSKSYASVKSSSARKSNTRIVASNKNTRVKNKIVKTNPSKINKQIVKTSTRKRK